MLPYLYQAENDRECKLFIAKLKRFTDTQLDDIYENVIGYRAIKEGWTRIEMIQVLAEYATDSEEIPKVVRENTQKVIANKLKERLWRKLNNAPHAVYIRFQRMFARRHGGWLRGLTIASGKVDFNIE